MTANDNRPGWEWKLVNQMGAVLANFGIQEEEHTRILNAQVESVKPVIVDLKQQAKHAAMNQLAEELKKHISTDTEQLSPTAELRVNQIIDQVVKALKEKK